MQLIDSVYIVTGGTSGIGKEIAKELVVNFATVIITGRDKTKLKAVAKEINAIYYHADVTDDAQINALFNYTLRKFGRLDGVINNAGIGDWCPVEEVTRERMQNVFEVNVYGAAMMTARAAVHFKKQKRGDIVNIASTASAKGYANGTIYAASKFALRGMTQCWQAELRPYNIRVIQVNPSEVPTAFGKADRIEKEPEEKKLTPVEIAQVVISALKMDNRGFIPEVNVFATNPF
ncbi:MAG: SDR family oxidoreductase [Crocinitomicaceae bacterium]|nr:SDR family oxidoreductase [Crocinitomicaceae bacterium]